MTQTEIPRNGNGRHRGRPRESELRADVAIIVESFDRLQQMRAEALKAAARSRAVLYREAQQRGIAPAVLRMLANV